MITVIQNPKLFLKYLFQVIKAWITWVFVCLDVVAFIIDICIPVFSPPRWLYLAIPCFGYFIANAEIFVDYQKRLAAYEDHAPEYDIQVSSVKTSICSNRCHVHIDCSINIGPTTPWTGYLEKLTVDRKSGIRGLGDWEIHDVTGKNCGPISFPFRIPDSMFSLTVSIRAQGSGQLAIADADKWRRAAIRPILIIGYSTQPVGKVEKPAQLLFEADIEKELRLVLEYQTMIGQ